ncbi:hypothetical protein BCR39DRAFT_80876 [Naematelia encephala]|uniref:Protein kinase domain-containing protein n=1 Tax=Naematelia encephala TaxID=71784 RepID=A0A1Y2BAD5_9TREE|nr:hypothetical protein BCR39DRAFT_80876 [Naematelia encephala]
MKIIKSLRYEPHPSIIQFEAFVICPSYALVIMPYLADLIPVCLPPARAIPYFRQLASAVGYLHERGITHNDIKPANVLLSHNDVPVLVDFGFAQRWDTRAESRGMFLSSIAWGTPEYLDPQRAIGMPHDERASDVWSLGITFFELLVGRTPFEMHPEEEFETAEEYMIYYERCKRGKWLGEWYISQDLEHLIRSMVCPDPAYRISAMQAYHHPSLQPTTPNVIITPHFVRAAASFEESDEPPVPNVPPAPPKKDQVLDEGKKKRRTKTREHQPVRTTTPTALGESIKQHTSVPRAKLEQHGKGAENAMPSPQQVIARSKKAEDMPLIKDGKEDMPTPTKLGKTAQPLRVKELNLAADARIAPRTSQSQINSLSRPTSQASLAPTITTKDKRASMLSAASSSNLRGANKSDAVLKTMRSLEGTHLTKKDVLSAISRPAPEPPRPRSLDSAEKTEKAKEKRLEQRRSLGILPGLKEESPSSHERKAVNHKNAASPEHNTNEHTSGPAAMPTPPRPRMNTRPTQVIREGDRFPAAMDEPASSPVANIRQRILSSDQEKLVRFRHISSEETTPGAEPAQASSSADVVESNFEEAVPSASPAKALDSRLESLATWVQQMERLVTDARRAIAEGRDPPALPMDMLTTLPADLSAQLQSSTAHHEEPEHRFGVTPDKKAIPEHLRTSSTQVEPATPPKWLTGDVLPETDKGDWVGDGKGAVRAKKDRPTVSHVLKLFGSEKAEKEREETIVARSKSPDPMRTVPLKAPALRGVPSTPALRSSFSTTRSRIPIARKSESNLRNFATAPTSSLGHALQPSPRRAVYEDLLDSTPGVTRQGDGWSSSLSSGKNVLGKPSSMASLRRAFLGERKIVDLADEVDKERERRPATPGTVSALGASAKAGDSKVKGLFGRIKRGFGGAK